MSKSFAPYRISMALLTVFHFLKRLFFIRICCNIVCRKLENAIAFRFADCQGSIHGMFGCRLLEVWPIYSGTEKVSPADRRTSRRSIANQQKHRGFRRCKCILAESKEQSIVALELTNTQKRIARLLDNSTSNLLIANTLSLNSKP
jgi:hypothetical protein